MYLFVGPLLSSMPENFVQLQALGLSKRIASIFQLLPSSFETLTILS